MLKHDIVSKWYIWTSHNILCITQFISSLFSIISCYAANSWLCRAFSPVSIFNIGRSRGSGIQFHDHPDQWRDAFEDGFKTIINVTTGRCTSTTHVLFLTNNAVFTSSLPSLLSDVLDKFIWQQQSPEGYDEASRASRGNYSLYPRSMG